MCGAPTCAAQTPKYAAAPDPPTQVITANNFCCTEWCLSRAGNAGYWRGRSLELAGVAAKLARDAAAAAARPVLVAGSLPPLRESYQVQGLVAFEEMQAQYHDLVTWLRPHCDLLLCETLSTATEGLAAGTAASASGLPWWLSYTIEDSEDGEPCLRSGEPLQVGWGRGSAAAACRRCCLR